MLTSLSLKYQFSGRWLISVITQLHSVFPSQVIAFTDRPWLAASPSVKTVRISAVLPSRRKPKSSPSCSLSISNTRPRGTLFKANTTLRLTGASFINRATSTALATQMPFTEMIWSPRWKTLWRCGCSRCFHPATLKTTPFSDCPQKGFGTSWHMTLFCGTR